MSYCPHCNQSTFEVEEVDVAGINYSFVQCTGCKSAIGVVASTTIGLPDVLRILISSLQRLNSRLERIEQALETKASDGAVQ
jgi:hypothetical protein